MAVFGVGGATGVTDEVGRYQVGRYISSGEALWRIFSSTIHERHPTVVHLATRVSPRDQECFFLRLLLFDERRQTVGTTRDGRSDPFHSHPRSRFESRNGVRCRKPPAICRDSFAVVTPRTTISLRRNLKRCFTEIRWIVFCGRTRRHWENIPSVLLYSGQ